MIEAIDILKNMIRFLPSVIEFVFRVPQETK